MLLKILRKTLAPFGMLLVIVVTLLMARKRFPFMKEIPPTVFWLILIGIIAIWLGVVLVRWIMERRQAAAIEDGILEQARAGADQASPARRADIEELNRNLVEALAMLKKGPQGQKALYTLPWYMIIGPPAIGKTTVIKNSNLSFPGMTTAKLMRGTGGTRNCDWWFSADAILLDTAGRYADGADRSETEGEWFAFLDMLKTHRKKRPIDGLILAFSVEDLYEKDEMALIGSARELRQRMDEILDRLGWTFPVYILFTKCDLISGFSGFFSSLSPVDRYQVWGAVHEPRPEGDQEAAERFSGEFDALLENLRTMRPRRMADVSRSEDWGRVFMFPEEFANLKDKLVLMIETLFEANPYRKDVPIYRGTFFSSGKQLGKPFDLVARKIQSMLGATSGVADVEEQEETDDAFFVRDLFAKVLKSDRGLVRLTGAAARRRSRLTLGISAAALLLSALACVWIGLSWGKLQRRMDQTRDIALEVQQQEAIGTPSEELRKLEVLRERIDGSWRSAPLLVKDSVHQAAREVYHEAITERFLRSVERQVARLLEAPSELNGSQVRRALRTELMLLMPDRKERIGWGAPELAEALIQYGLDDVSGDPDAQALLEATVEVFLELGQPIGNLDRERALERGARRLAQTHAPHEFYRGIVAEASLVEDDLSLDDLNPGQSVLVSDGEVKAAYTWSGWTETVKPAIESVHETIAADNDLIELAGGQATSRVPSQKELFDLYRNDYPEEWVDFVESVRLKKFADARDLEEDLKDLRRDRSSPLYDLVRQMTAASSLAPRPAPEGIPLEETVEEIQRDMMALHGLVGEEGEASEVYAEYVETIQEIYGQLADYVADPTVAPDWSAFRDARLWVDDFENDHRRSSLASALKKLLIRPIDVTEQIMRQGVASARNRSLRAEWSAIYEQFDDKLRPYYPFASGGENADKGDVVAFHCPEGILAGFGPERSSAGPSIRAALDRSEELRDELNLTCSGFETRFTLRAGEVRALEGSMQGRQNKAKIDKFVLRINGDELVDRLAETEKRFTWSSEDPEQSCSLVLVSASERRDIASLEFENSTWSICRLFDAARFTDAPGGRKVVTWAFPDYGIEVDFTLETIDRKELFFLPGSRFRTFTLPSSVSE